MGYGDGMCCSYGNGSYKVTYGGAVVAEGGNFGASETAEFGEDESTPAPVNPTQSPVNPTQSPIGSPVESPTEEFSPIFTETFDIEGEYQMNVGNKVVEASNMNPTYSGDHSLRLRKKQGVVSKNQN